MSPNYPLVYGRNQACTLRTLGMFISSVDFLTEAGFDTLTLNEVGYSGTTRPAVGLYVEGSMSWTSDYSEQKSGWKICHQALVPIWTAFENARAYGNGGLKSTGGEWATSDADSSVPPSALGIAFKLGTSGEAAIGFHCGTTGTWTDLWGTSACYYAIYKHYDGATYISEPGQPLEPPTSVDPALLNPDWANDRWQLKITPTGEVEYFRNSVRFYISDAQISGSFKLHAAFNANGKVTEVKFLYEATTAAPTTAAPTTT